LKISSICAKSKQRDGTGSADKLWFGNVNMSEAGYQAAIVAFIRSNAITQWPTACAVALPGCAVPVRTGE
jgi:hypothetical protein